MVEPAPTVAQIWAWLDAIPDPEIPVVSIVDLGIVRDVTRNGDRTTIAITPTYSGCPATSVIAQDIDRGLRARGLRNFDITRQLSPAWTTDWMSAKARNQLAHYGIAPPSKSGGPDKCPRCGAADLEKISQFGSTPCKAQWRCKDCLEPFDYFKCL